MAKQTMTTEPHRMMQMNEENSEAFFALQTEETVYDAGA